MNEEINKNSNNKSQTTGQYSEHREKEEDAESMKFTELSEQ
jgi:hypothetical protein